MSCGYGRLVETALGVLQTPDGAWRVEIIRSGHAYWYRLIHGDNIIDGLAIATVEQLLNEAGVDRSTLTEVRDEPADSQGKHGVA